ncbi:ubiquitin carrier protein [Xylaria nigripes]|nr:ubiquitin carrier protein [Xylaria nigripes]
MYHDIATIIYKRGDTSVDGYQMPQWALVIFILNIIFLLPLYLIISYTFQFVYPTLAIVEDPSPPFYESVSLNEDGQSIAEVASGGPAVTASLRSTHRAVYAIAGWRSLFRGFQVFFFLRIATAVIITILGALRVPALIAAAIVPLALVQPYAVWTHIVISNPSSRDFWQRLPPFKRAFKATAMPLVLNSIAKKLLNTVPFVVASLLRTNMWSWNEPKILPQHDIHDAWKIAVVLLVSFAIQVVLVIPTQVVLTRVQASFLPEEYDTIVPFDRSLGAKVEPAIVDGKGYVNMLDVLKRFSRASWIRLSKLYLKIFAIVIALSFLPAVILILEYFILASNSRKVDGEL